MSMSALFLYSENAPSKQLSRRLSWSLSLFGIVAIATFAWALNAASADDTLDATCNELKHEMGNCSCATEFLTQNVGAKNALILMQGWTIAAGRKGDITEAMGPFYREHNDQELLQASTSFLKVRLQFHMHCELPSSNLWDLN
jgi:hypothetical protein